MMGKNISMPTKNISKAPKKSKGATMVVLNQKTNEYVYFDGYMESCGICRLEPDVYAMGILPDEDVQMIIYHLLNLRSEE